MLALLACTVSATAGRSEKEVDDVSPRTTRQLVEEGEEQDRREAERRAQLASPEFRAERLRSRNAHSGISAQQSISLVRDSFPKELEALALDPGRALGETRAENYLSDRAALIDPGDAGGPKHVAATTVPIRTEKAGEKKPLDLRLVSSSGALVPRRSHASLVIPASADEAIRMGDRSIGVHLRNAKQSAGIQFGERDVLYPDVATDTDMLVSPVTLGAEIFLQLRSQASPEEPALRVSLPQGATLEERPEGGAAVVREDEDLMLIAPPVATDAQGQDVPVTMSAEGELLRLEIPHRSEDIAYPLLVDPPFTYTFFEQQNPPGLDLWTQHDSNDDFVFSTNDGHFETDTTCRPHVLPGDTQPSCPGWAIWPGLYAYASPGKYKGGVDVDADHSHWHYNVPHYPSTTAYIPRITFRHMWYRGRSNHDAPFMFMAMNTPDDGPNFSSRHVWRTNNDDTSDKTQDMLPCEDDPAPCDDEGVNSAVFGFGMGLVDREIPNWRDAYLGEATIYLQDPDKPRITAGTNAGPTGWVDSTTYQVQGAAARDDGLGVKTLTLTVPGSSPQTRTHPSCNGAREAPCPQDLILPSSNPNLPNFDAYSTDSMPEGTSFVDLTATDILDKTADETDDREFPVRVDRSPPEIETGGGLSVVAPARGADYELHVEGHDGAPTPLSGQRSGMKSIEVKVNGEQVAFEQQPCPVDPGSCSQTLDYELDPYDYPEDEVTIEVIATDQLGHEAREEWQATLARSPPDLVGCCLTHDGLDDWNDDRNVKTTAYARDRQSGIASFGLLLPGDQQQVISLECGEAGQPDCPEYAARAFEYDTGTFPEGEHEGSVRAKNPNGDASASKRFPIRVDHSDPVIDNTAFDTSTMYLSRTSLAQELTYELNINATDGTAQELRSGVRSIEVEVDDERKFFAAQPCEEGSCSMNRTFKFRPNDYPLGDHHVKVIVTDGVGRTAIREFDVIVVSGVQPPEVVPPRGGDRFGLEQYFHYDSTETGQSSAHVNLATGNAVWHKVPLVNQGRGLATFMNTTYSSFDQPVTGDVPPLLDSRMLGTDYDEIGLGFSAAISGLTRINEPLGGVAGAGTTAGATPATVVLTDADGTRHTFTLSADSISIDPPGVGLVYDPPPGVNLRLRMFSDPVTDLLAGRILPEQRDKAWAITRPDGVTYFFDGWGFARSIADRNGNEIRFEYENRLLASDNDCEPLIPVVCEPRLVRVIDATGVDGSAPAATRTVTIDYFPPSEPNQGARGKVRQLTDHAGRVLRFTYNSDGYLEAMSEAADSGAEAKTTAFAYDDPEGTLERPQLQTITDPRGSMTTIGYEENSSLIGDFLHGRRVASITNRRQNQRSLAYDQNQMQMEADEPSGTTVTDARGNPTAYELDGRDRPRLITDPLGTMTQLDWDADNNVVRMIDAVGSPDAATTGFAYNENGLLTHKVDPLGRLTQLTYASSAGILRSELEVDQDSDGFVSDLVAMRRPEGNTWTFELESGTATDGSPATRGNVTARIDPDGNRAETDYGPRGEIVEEREEFEPGKFNVTRYPLAGYDPNGLPREVITPRGNPQMGGEPGEDPQQHRWLYRYDAVGNTTHVTDPRGSLGFAPGGAIPTTFTSTLTYDDLDRLTAEMLPKLSQQGQFITRSYDYDKNGNQTARTDGNAKTTTLTYNAMDRVVSEISPLGEETGYDYDSEDGLVEQVSPKGSATGLEGDFTTQYELDPIGRRLAEVRQSRGPPDPEQDLITTYAYDRRDNRVGMVDPRRNEGRTVADAIAAAQTPANLRTSYEYDQADQLLAEVEDPGVLALRTQYIYDENGNKIREIGPRGFSEGPPGEFTKCFYFDPRDLLVGETNHLGDLTTYERRADGKVIAEISPRGTESEEAGDFATEYTYDANGELASRSIPHAPGQYGKSEAELDAWKVTYTRDAVGNPTEILDARGNQALQAGLAPESHRIDNTFFDTGDLRTTSRPSFWKLDWGEEGNRHADPDPGIKFGSRDESAGGSAPDLMLPQGGPKLIENPGEGPGDGDAADSHQPDVAPASGAGDFGEVDPKALRDQLPRAGLTTLEYDDEMRVSSIAPAEIDGQSPARGIEYDDVGRILTKTWPFKAGVTIGHELEYDRNGNLTRFVDGEGYDTTFTYDQYDRRTEELAPGSKTGENDPVADDELTKLTYDPNGNLLTRATPRNFDPSETREYIFEFEYDPVDRLTHEQNPAEEPWEYAYDAAGNRITETSPRGFSEGPPSDFTTTITYDSVDRPIRIDEPESRVTKMEYDENANQIELSEPGAQTSASGGVEPHVTKRTFDGRDLPWQTTVGSGGYERTTVREFDPNGNLRRVVNPKGVGSNGLPNNPDLQFAFLEGATQNATVRQYNGDNLLKAVFLPWDNTGDSSDPNGYNQVNQNGKQYRQDFDYDQRGRILNVDAPYKFAGAAPDPDPKTSRTSYEHFDTDWVLSSSNAEYRDPQSQTPVTDRELTYDYDNRGNQILWVSEHFPESPNGRKITRDFHPSGLLASRKGIKPAEGENPKRTYDYFYNPNRSLIKIIDVIPPDRVPQPYQLELTRRTEIYRDRAERERRVNEDWRGGRDTGYDYDDDGNVTKRQTEGTLSDPENSNSYLGGKTTSFELDKLGRETKMTVTGDGNTRSTETTYYPSGNIATREDPRDAVETFFYRTDGLVARMMRTAAGSANKDLTYAYDVNGNRTKDERGDHTYNSRDQLVLWKRSQGPNAGHHVSYKLNGTGSITHRKDQAHPGHGEADFSYDGSRLETVEDSLVRSTYFYDDFGNVVRIKNQAKSGGTFPDAPDPPDPGDICDRDAWTQSTTTFYCYDEFERLVTSKGPDQTNPRTYVHDGLDRRDLMVVNKSTGDEVRELFYVGTSEMLSREKEADNTVKTYDYSARGVRQGQRVVQPSGSGSYKAYAKDANGSVEAIENTDGTISSSKKYRYDPYGELEQEESDLGTDAQENPFRFEGFYYDSGIKSYDMLAREYRPEIGRFLSQDRYEDSAEDLNLQSDPLTQNRYAFAGGNPVTNVEFDGHCWGPLRFLRPYCKAAVKAVLGRRVGSAVNQVLFGGPARQRILHAARLQVQLQIVTNPLLRRTSPAFRQAVIRSLRAKTTSIEELQSLNRQLLALSGGSNDGLGNEFIRIAFGSSDLEKVVSLATLGLGAKLKVGQTVLGAVGRVIAGSGFRERVAFHYTFSRFVQGIERAGLRRGTYLTTSGRLSPLQAHIDLALRPNRGLPDVLYRVDLRALRQAGYKIPPITRVPRAHNLPGGARQLRFPYRIPPEFLTRVR